MNDTKPTQEFRWLIIDKADNNGSHPSALLHNERQIKVLQQKHESYFEGKPDAWKDIPMVMDNL